MEEAKSLSTMAAPRQKLMNERATVVATTTFAVVTVLLLTVMGSVATEVATVEDDSEKPRDAQRI
jgi:hypothetical protein